RRSGHRFADKDTRQLHALAGSGSASGSWLTCAARSGDILRWPVERPARSPKTLRREMFMSAIAEPFVDTTDRLATRNALVLAAAQALAGGNSVVIVGTAGIVGGALADKSLATVPVSTY